MGGSKSPPDAPNLSQDYEQMIQVYLKNLPTLLNAETSARATQDPANIQHTLDINQTYGNDWYQQQLDALKKLDPIGQQARMDLGNAVSGDLKSGYQLPPGYDEELNTQIRGAQAAHGGSPIGNAGISAEALFKGKAAADLYQQHLDNVGQFLGLQTPEAQVNQVAPPSSDAPFKYVDPAIGLQGAQYGLNAYGAKLAGYQTSQGANPWARALSGAGQGALAGYSAGGGWGALIGAGVGAAGGYASDRRLKKDIVFVGLSDLGHRIYEFAYRGLRGRFRGVMADEVRAIRPDAVIDGDFLRVDYDQIDVPFMEVVSAT